jgi:uncharacterized lipoprotein YbaY
VLEQNLPDRPARIVAKKDMSTDRNQVPLSFYLNFSGALVHPENTYHLRAEITVKGHLWFSGSQTLSNLNGDRENLVLTMRRAP